MMVGAYERVAQRLLKNQPRPKPFCVFVDSQLHIGTQSLHRTSQSRLWRLFWRLKTRRTV